MAYSASWANHTSALGLSVSVAPTIHDYLIAGCVMDSSSGTIVTPTGFSTVTGSPLTTSGFDGQILWLFYKADATGSETSVVFDNDTTIGFVMAFSGRDNSVAPEIIRSAKKDDGAQGTPWGGTTTAFTPTAGADLFAVLGSDVNSGADNPVHTFSDSINGSWGAAVLDGHNGFFNYGADFFDNTTAVSHTATVTGTLAGADAEWAYFVLALKPSASSDVLYAQICL